ncbi:hypothetical protein U9M48_027910 [Paspalum notatum var. saurae]|uniref:Uncharacterized protein n=1 Tax=Paspalum notatum var. saurae TaxID=547442 RepID=A0AAQ3TY51_PASNO
MMDSLTDIQQQQGFDHNLILETRATVDRMHGQSLMYYNWKGFFPKSNHTREHPMYLRATKCWDEDW